MSKSIVIVGATGAQGRAAIKYFQQHEPSWHIRGLTRTPRSKAALALADSGIEIVEANLNDVKSLKSAFKGASYIFAYTDFSGIVRGPEVMGKFKAGELAAPIGAESYKIELQQGKNIADAAATVPGLKRLVYSALPGVKQLSGGKYLQVFHFDAKAEAFEYMLGIPDLKDKVSAVHMSAFVTNAINGLDLFKLWKQEDGTILWKPVFPIDVPMPYIDIEKDTGSYVHALIKAPAPTQVLAVSEWATPRQWLEKWSQATSVASRIERAGPEQFKGDDPTGFMGMMIETSGFIEELGFAGGDRRILMPEELEQQHGVYISHTKLTDYLSREDWSSIVG
ncbi:hypothetical protein MBLNU13_g08459t1 [Cladosporium sp. NU13]